LILLNKFNNSSIKPILVLPDNDFNKADANYTAILTVINNFTVKMNEKFKRKGLSG